MAEYIVKRLLSLLVVILGVTFLIYLIFYALPGDVTQFILGVNYTEAGAEQLREELGLNRPFLVQYFSYLGGLLQGNFGTSYVTGAPVAVQLAARFPRTLVLVLCSMVLCTVVSIPMGVYCAIKPRSPLSAILQALGMVGIAMPSFWLGLLLILLFSVKLGWLPSLGSMTPAGLVLPSITLAASFLASSMRITRSSMLEVMGQDYIRTARAKGVPYWGVIYHHAMKNSMLPVITMIGMNVGSQMGGSILTETVFSYQGIGLLLMDSISSRDIPTVLGCIVLMALSIGVCNMLVDILMLYIDPRLRGLMTKGA
jgi:peptide/nickel transport system permease protein